MYCLDLEKIFPMIVAPDTPFIPKTYETIKKDTAINRDIFPYHHNKKVDIEGKTYYILMSFQEVNQNIHAGLTQW